MAPGDGMRLWLRETARRLAMNELRRKRPKPLEPRDLIALPGMEDNSESLRGLVEPFDEELTVLRVCLAELPEEDRKLLTERYHSSTPIADLAEQMGLSADYLKLKLFRLRKTLGERIKRKVNERLAKRDGYAERGA
jgi:RNA polymerase sigma factor (sigma-70 family)